MDKFSIDEAKQLDLANPATQRCEFWIPAAKDGSKCIYFCGNSLGLQPKTTKTLINQELDVWANQGVSGHFEHPHNRPWVTIDEIVTKETARIVGACEDEVVVMNSLTANLHFLMVAFYNPTPKRSKILMEAKAFPSDYYAIASQVVQRGYDPEKSIIQVSPNPGEYTLDTERILEIIGNNHEEIALVLMSGVQYYTGQCFDMERITRFAQSKGCIVGWDLAHAVGNVMLQLHDWNVDFAVWCTYKYLNSGPGNIGGAFLHRNHHSSNLKMFSGWWGQNPASKFNMSNEFDTIPNALGLRLSNPSVLSIISLYSSLQIFSKTSMQHLHSRSKLLTGYLEAMIDSCIDNSLIKIITPRQADSRGCQLSLLFCVEGMMERVFSGLAVAGIVCDERKPDVLRVSPTPLYNTFEEIWMFVNELQIQIGKCLDETKGIVN